MTNAAAAVPAGVLGGICVICFIFIWWWFPRHYKKGMKMDMVEADEDRRQLEDYTAIHGNFNRNMIARHEARLAYQGKLVGQISPDGARFLEEMRAADTNKDLEANRTNVGIDGKVAELPTYTGTDAKVAELPSAHVAPAREHE